MDADDASKHMNIWLVAGWVQCGAGGVLQHQEECNLHSWGHLAGSGGGGSLLQSYPGSLQVSQPPLQVAPSTLPI